MSVVSYILATAGHVDHGKSAVVRTLTGTDPDRLPEEKARGITIELGFAHLDLPGPGETTFRVGVVDVPGHEDFVKNMVAGVGSIDIALLVVAADDGWMPQTEEHLQILAYLGVTRGVVALTKIDLTEDEPGVRVEIRKHLRGSPLEDAPIVATSTRTARGFDDLKLALANTITHAPPPRDIGKPRLPLDRAFALKGVGTVCTGTLTGGTLRIGQTVVVQPTGVPARIRNLQSHNRDVEIAHPGSRVAVNLADVEVRGDHSAHGDRVVGRGDVVTIPQLGEPTEVFDVVVARSPRSDPALLRAPPLKHGALVQVHHGTRAVGARVRLFNATHIEAGMQSVARLRLQSKLFVFAGDRFVIRDWSEQHTLAGGIVLDTSPPKQPDLADLERLARDPFDVAAHVEVRLLRVASLPRATLLAQSIFDRTQVDDAVARLTEDAIIVALGPHLCSRQRWHKIRATAIANIDEAHRAHPEWTGLALSELRHQLEAEISGSADLFDLLVEELCREGFVRRGTSIGRASHAPALPPRLQSAGQALRKLLAVNPFEPPSRNQLAPDATSLQTLKFLITSGEAVEISSEIVLSADAFSRATEQIREHIRSHGPSTVSELKNVLGSSRRIMVPLLEKLDRDGVTRREGDRRSLK